MWYIAPGALIVLGLIPVWLIVLTGALFLLLLCLGVVHVASVYLEGKYGD